MRCSKYESSEDIQQTEGGDVIYVEDKTQDIHFKLLEKIASSKKLELVFWSYQDYEEGEFLGQPISSASAGEAVTKYGDGAFPYNTSRIEYNADILALINQNKKMMEEHCDSIALYAPGSHDWYMCTIGHESLSLIRDDSLEKALSSNGSPVSLEAPT